MGIIKTWDQRLGELKSKESEARRGGGEDRLQKQRDMGKMTARERIDYILDPDSFVELNMLVEHQCRDFGMDNKKFAGDGVVTGYGTIEDRNVYIYSEDDTVLGGCLDIDASDKASRFVRTCDVFNIPFVTLVDVPGFLPGVRHQGRNLCNSGPDRSRV